MKRLIMLLLGIFMLAGSAQALTIEGVYLWGGNGDTFNTWGSNTYRWNTFPDYSIWVLGVSSAPGGPLLNAPNTTVSGLTWGNYYLYAQPLAPTDLGSNPKLQVYLSDGTILSAIFHVAGTSGTGTSWTRTAGSADLTLGWALGTANLVGRFESMGPYNGNDFYLQVGVQPVPLPGAVWLLGSGLLGLLGWRRFRKG